MVKKLCALGFMSVLFLIVSVGIVTSDGQPNKPVAVAPTAKSAQPAPPLAEKRQKALNKIKNFVASEAVEPGISSDEDVNRAVDKLAKAADLLASTEFVRAEQLAKVELPDQKTSLRV
jgi:hypothetical protein